MAGEEASGRPRGPSDRSDRARFGPRRALFWLVAFAPPVFWLASTVLPASPGPRQLRWVADLAGAYGFVGISVYPVALLLAAVSAAIVRPPRRRELFWVALSLLIGTALIPPSGRVSSRARMLLIRQATVRAEPLVHALERYRQDQRRYPTALDELQPKYLAEVPGTGMIGYPDFVYVPPGDAEPTAGGYVLRVRCGEIGRFDSLHYWPSHHYPDTMHGGIVERIDGWAYVHE